MPFSLSHQLVRAAELPCESPQIIGPSGTHTWRSLADEVARFAGVLRSLGVAGGDRVAILTMNSSEYLSLYLAIPWAGGITVPVNTRLAAPEVEYWLDDSGSSVLFVDDAFTGMIGEMRGNLRTVRHVVYLGEQAAPSGMESMTELLQGAEPVADAGRRDDDVAMLCYTGGTTGKSKGVKLTHQGFIFAALSWSHAVGVGRDDTLMIVVPMFHLAAALNTIASVVLAARVVIMPGFDPAQTLAAIEQHRVSKLALVPTILDMLINAPQFPGTDISSLRRITYGGAPMPAPILENALEKMPGTRFYQIYGQTESGGCATCLPPEYHALEGELSGKRKTAGKPIIGMEVRILSEENQEVPTGTVGEICLRSPTLTPGYWGLPDQTEAVYTGDWLHTGDAGYLDEQGFLTIVDRIKDMIISGGENVYAVEVEAVLYQHPAIAECAVIGIPSEKWGEQVHGVVRLHEGAEASEQEIIDFCRSKIAGYKSVRSVEFRTEPFPISGMNKILKRELREPYWKSD